MRRAVIILNTVSIVANYIGLIALATDWIPTFQDAKDDLVDKYGKDSSLTLEQSDTLDELLRRLIFLTVAYSVTSLLAIVGAIYYEPRLLRVQVMYAVTNLALTIVFNNKAADEVETYDYGVANYASYIVGTALSIYVHVSLYREIKNGTMSKETYAATEAHSCCCLQPHTGNDDDEAELELGEHKTGTNVEGDEPV